MSSSQTSSTSHVHPSKINTNNNNNKKAISLGDVVQLSHGRIGVVKYIGDIMEYIERGITGIFYGIEIRMTTGKFGNSNGQIGDTKYFECASNNGIFLKLNDIFRRVEPSELLTKWVTLTKKNSTMHKLLQSSYNEHNKLTKKYNTLKKKFNIIKKKRAKEKEKYKKQTQKNSHSKNQQSYSSRMNHKTRQFRSNTSASSVDYEDIDEHSIISDAPRSSLEFSISNDYSVTYTNSKYAKFSNENDNDNDDDLVSFKNDNSCTNNFDLSDDDTLTAIDLEAEPPEISKLSSLGINDEIKKPPSHSHHVLPQKINTKNFENPHTRAINKIRRVMSDGDTTDDNMPDGAYKKSASERTNKRTPTTAMSKSVSFTAGGRGSGGAMNGKNGGRYSHNFGMNGISPIKVASPLKTANSLISSEINNNKPSLDVIKQKRQSQPQLLIAMTNELSPTSFLAKNKEISKWDKKRVLQWVDGFAEKNQKWQNLKIKITTKNVNGSDLLSMDETNLLSDLGVHSPSVRYKIMSQLGLLFKSSGNHHKFPSHKALFSLAAINQNNQNQPRSSLPVLLLPSLQNSNSTPIFSDDPLATATPPLTRTNYSLNKNHQSNHNQHNHTEKEKERTPRSKKKNNKNNKNVTNFPYYNDNHNHNQSEKGNRKVTFNNNESNSYSQENEEKMNGNINTNVIKKEHHIYGSFKDLNKFFNTMDRNKTGKVDFSGFRFMVIELVSDLEPYKLSNENIQKCFNEFDLTKNGHITIEEFIVVMGKTYLRGLSKLQHVTTSDIKRYFISLIKHFMKKIYNDQNDKNDKRKHNKRQRSRSRVKLKRNNSRSRSGSGRPPPIPRKLSSGRNVQPPPRDRSPSRSRSRSNYGNKPPPPPRKYSNR